MANTAQICGYPPSPDALRRLLSATWVLQWLRGEDVHDVRQDCVREFLFVY